MTANWQIEMNDEDSGQTRDTRNREKRMEDRSRRGVFVVGNQRAKTSPKKAPGVRDYQIH